ncbi:MAG: hypothetical protein CALGDGBN_01926 [Pseudomonadales bacterium]|nr:hypothetical protein [Pseudomonadales bacterium]
MRRERRAQGQRAHSGRLAVGQGHHHQVVTGLPGARRPGELAAHGVERGTLRQPHRREAQRLAGVGIAGGEGECERLAEHDLTVVQLADHGRPVDVGHTHHDRDLVARAIQIAGAETEHVLAGLLLAGRPLEAPFDRVEEHALGSRAGLRHAVARVAEQRIHHCITVRIAREQRELQHPQFLAA